MTIISKTCPCCGNTTHVLLQTEEDERRYQLWKERKMLIQEAFPNFTAEIRETLITGFCENCQHDIFEGEEE